MHVADAATRTCRVDTEAKVPATVNPARTAAVARAHSIQPPRQIHLGRHPTENTGQSRTDRTRRGVPARVPTCAVDDRSVPG